MSDLDITRNVKIIEKLKSELLSGVADLYESMLMPSWHETERADIFADIVIKSYILAKRTGIDYSELDGTIAKKLRLEVLEEGRMADDCGRVLRYMEQER